MSLLDRLRAEPLLARKARFLEEFWRGEGPFPILFAKPHLALGPNYRRWNLLEQRADPAKLLEEALVPALAVLEGFDDGLPLVRADLGTTLFPSALGLALALDAELHPSLASRLDPALWAGRAVTPASFAAGGEIPLADAMYRLLAEGRASGAIPAAVMPYLPDNQGVFDLSHIIAGSDIFYAFADDPGLLDRVQERSLALFLEGSRHFKALLGEEPDSMLHGHGMASGLWFPDTGIRISEDSCTLLSVPDIERHCMPWIERAIAPFGRGFLHFCGRHEGFLRLACAAPLVSTLNLGNPEAYDLGELFALCAAGGTTYFGHLPRLPGEGDEEQVERIAELALRAGCRVAFVAQDVADPRTCARLWHRLTTPR